MAKFYSGLSVADVYDEVIGDLIDAEVSSPRGMKTKELLNVSFEIGNPRNRLIYHPERGFNVSFGLAELVSCLTGVNTVNFLSKFNSNIAQFSDNDVVMYGNYGIRITKYLKQIIQKLKDNPETRQANITIYNTEDSFIGTKDVPCTVSMDFKVRDNKLYMHTFMRSNDLVWGFQYDVFFFTLIQEIIANELNVELGSYNHTATSFHVYERHFDLIEEMYETGIESVKMPKSEYLVEDIEDIANKIFDFNKTPNLTGNDFLDVLKVSYHQKHSNTKYDLSSFPNWARYYLE
jgi:thymidylate synthase